MIEEKTIISGLKFPESPVFDSRGNLWFVEIQGGNLSCWDGQKLSRFDVDGTPNGLKFDQNGLIWFTDSGRGEIRKFDSFNQSFQTICTRTVDSDPLKCPNDLIFDVAGNLLFSDHADGREDPVSTICVLSKGSSQAKVISKNKLFTNGLAFRHDNKILLYAETYRQQIWIGDWDADSLTLQNESVFAKAGEGPWGPDGMVFDEDENLFVAIFNENKVNVYNKQGEMIFFLNCKGSRPTSCTFDPSGKLGLVVTEAELGEIIAFPKLAMGLSSI